MFTSNYQSHRIQCTDCKDDILPKLMLTLLRQADSPITAPTHITGEIIVDCTRVVSTDQE